MMMESEAAEIAGMVATRQMHSVAITAVTDFILQPPHEHGRQHTGTEQEHKDPRRQVQFAQTR